MFWLTDCHRSTHPHIPAAEWGKETPEHVCGRGLASYKLVPGDIVVLQPGRATCDMVLLQGNCLVDESIISGEVPCCVY